MRGMQVLSNRINIIYLCPKKSFKKEEKRMEKHLGSTMEDTPIGR
jgi:hypothetical protein